jgi:hypothetical protein
MESMNTTETDTTETEPTNNSSPIELSIVQGETSGIFKIDPRLGSIEFSEDISYDQWKEVLRLARTVRRKAAIMVADCISIGVKKWGRKKVDEALEQLELEVTLVKTAVAINSIPYEIRQENLDAEHYIELSRAQLTKAKAIRWARIAGEQRLTPAQLRYQSWKAKSWIEPQPKCYRPGSLPFTASASPLMSGTDEWVV